MPALTGAEARERFAASPVARLATADAAGRPHLVPVVFVVADACVAMAVDHKPKRSPRLKRLANIRANPAVCLLVDHYDDDWDRLWWVRADGRAHILPPPDRSADAKRWTALLAAKYPRHYAEHAPAGEIVQITVTRWTGWHAT
jgi:PPOX class probable F420-dependent enzyme